MEWWNDMHCLDISAMVGPAYVLKDLYPRKGPVTGGTPLDLIGEKIEGATTRTAPRCCERLRTQGGTRDEPKGAIKMGVYIWRESA